MIRRIPKRAIILETWRCVYRYCWRDADDPARINADEVFCHEGRYVVVPSFGSRPIGQYADCFEAVRKHGLHFVMGSAVEVVCPEIETRTLARQLACGEDLRIGFKLKLNGEWYQVTPARIFGHCRRQDGAVGSST